MPELPEVETIRRGLEQLIIGSMITQVDVRLPKMVRGEIDRLSGATIIGVRRRGKGLLIDLSNEYTLAVHVKMTGQLIYKRVSRAPRASKGVKNLHPQLSVPMELPSKHTHVILRLSVPQKRHSGKPKAHPESLTSQVEKDPGQARMTNNNEDALLFYNDIRQFGWLHVVPTREADALPFFTSLGPEPLNNLTIKQFSNILSRSKAPIKQVLMDQTKLAGVGNIYANDALFHAGIHPLRPANELTETERKKLFMAVEYVLQEGITAGGASEENFVNALGEKGFYQERFLVYKQTGKPCKTCGTAIERIVIGGRGTFYCPNCQQ